LPNCGALISEVSDAAKTRHASPPVCTVMKLKEMAEANANIR
jgi:hypothetical protein